MAGAVFHRDGDFTAVAKAKLEGRHPLPRGYGLLVGAGVSLILWAGLALGLLTLLT